MNSGTFLTITVKSGEGKKNKGKEGHLRESASQSSGVSHRIDWHILNDVSVDRWNHIQGPKIHTIFQNFKRGVNEVLFLLEYYTALVGSC